MLLVGNASGVECASQREAAFSCLVWAGHRVQLMLEVSRSPEDPLSFGCHSQCCGGPAGSAEPLRERAARHARRNFEGACGVGGDGEDLDQPGEGTGPIEEIRGANGALPEWRALALQACYGPPRFDRR